MGALVPTVRTPVDADAFTRSATAAWQRVEGVTPSRESLASLWGQVQVETGGSSLFNWNVGNVKHSASDGLDFVALRGVWEGVSPAEAERLIASGQATEDPSQDHAVAVGPGKVSVVFEPPHPATLFRAYPDLDAALESHLRLLKSRFPAGYAPLLRGDPDGFARGLKANGYYTASADVYSRGVVANANRYLGGSLPIQPASFSPPGALAGVASGVQIAALPLVLAAGGAALLAYVVVPRLPSLARSARRMVRA